MMRGFAYSCINLPFSQVYTVTTVRSFILFYADLCHSPEMTTIWLFGAHGLRWTQSSEVAFI